MASKSSVSVAQYDSISGDILDKIKNADTLDQARLIVDELRSVDHGVGDIRKACELTLLENAHMHGHKAFHVASALGEPSLRAVSSMVIRMDQRFPEPVQDLAKKALGLRQSRSARR